MKNKRLVPGPTKTEFNTQLGNAVLGFGALILPHATVNRKGTVVTVTGKVHIKKGAIIGANSMIMPNVTIGENAMVHAMSLVPMNTHIGPNEVWGGIPARNLSHVKHV